MKPIKFRFYNEDTKTMHELDELSIGFERVTSVTTAEGWEIVGRNLRKKISSATDRLDKNGQLIFEGDVWKRGIFIGIVTWDFSRWIIKKVPQSNVYSYPAFYSNAYKGEIIGNIWQNPEYAEEKTEGQGIE